jgi:hypothetical protein
LGQNSDQTLYQCTTPTLTNPVNFESTNPGISSVVSPTVADVHALVFTHALAGTHALASVSSVVGSSVAGVVSLKLVQHDVLAMPEKSSGPRNETFYIPLCHKSLVPGGRPFWHWEM